MYYVVECVKINRVVASFNPTRNYDSALTVFDTMKKRAYREIRMVRVKEGARTILKYAIRGRRE